MEPVPGSEKNESSRLDPGDRGFENVECKLGVGGAIAMSESMSIFCWCARRCRIRLRLFDVSCLDFNALVLLIKFDRTRVRNVFSVETISSLMERQAVIIGERPVL